MRFLFVLSLLFLGTPALVGQPILVPPPADSLVTQADAIIDSLRTTKQFVRDEVAVDYVRAVVAEILAATNHDPAPFAVHVQSSLTVNAYVLPNAAIVVTSGLLLRLSSREELAMILGHEIGHYILGHHSAPRDTLLYDANLRSLTQEYEADSVGMAFLRRMNIDPQAGVCALEKLPPDANGLLINLPFFRFPAGRSRRITHPPTPRRVALLRKHAGLETAGECTGSGEYTTSLQALRNDTRWDMLLAARVRKNRTIQIITIDSLLDNTAVEPGSDYYGLLRYQQAEAIISLLRGGNVFAAQDLKQGKAETTYRNNDLAAEREYYATTLSSIFGGNALAEAHQMFSPQLLRNLAELDALDAYRTEALRLRGLYLDHIGHYVEARRAITEYLSLHPTNPARRYAASLLDRMPKKNRKKPLY